jgi:hypothetical protein
MERPSEVSATIGSPAGGQPAERAGAQAMMDSVLSALFDGRNTGEIL